MAKFCEMEKRERERSSSEFNAGWILELGLSVP